MTMANSFVKGVSRKKVFFAVLIGLIFLVSLSSVSISTAQIRTLDSYTIKWKVDDRGSYLYVKVSANDDWTTDLSQRVTVQLKAIFGSGVRKFFNVYVYAKLETPSKTYTLDKGAYEIDEQDTWYSIDFDFYPKSSDLNLKEGKSVTASVYVKVDLREDIAFAFDEDVSTGWNSYISVTITRPDNTKPTVTITSPVSGSTVSGVVKIKVSAKDYESGIESVYVRIDSNSWVVASYSDGYYVYSWDTTKVSNGEHRITARAEDKFGNAKDFSITVIVQNIQEQTPNSGSSNTGDEGTPSSGSLNIDNNTLIVGATTLVSIVGAIGALLRKR